MAEDIKEAKTEDLMAEAEQLHDIIYNIGCAGTSDKERLQALYAEIEDRGIGVVEQYTVTFVESIIDFN